MFDEPTTALNHHDVVRLFSILTRLRDAGRRGDLRQPPLPRGPRDLRRVHRAAQRAPGRPARRASEASVERLVELTLGQKAESAFARGLAQPSADAGSCAVSDLRSGRACTTSASRCRGARSSASAGCSGWVRRRSPARCSATGFDIGGSVDIGGAPPSRLAARRRSGAASGTSPRAGRRRGSSPTCRCARTSASRRLSRLVLAPYLRVLAFSRERRLVRGVAERTGHRPSRARPGRCAP